MKFKIVLLFIFSTVVLLFIFVQSLPDNHLHLVFCDVGQGDAIYVRGPKGSDMVIDGGPDERVLNCLGEKMPFWDRTIELLVLSHPQADHLTGLIEIVKRFEVKKLVDSSAKNNTAEYYLWEKLIKEKKIKRIEARAGEKIMVDKEVELSVLWPKNPENTSEVKPSSNLADTFEAEQQTLDLNSSSTVLSLSFNHFSSLFTGDLDSDSLNSLISLISPISLTILKFPHHGSKTGLSEAFLKAVSPALAIISVGKNSFGHPSAETPKLLNSLNIPFLRTDEDKTIEIVSDGKVWYRKL